MFAIYFAFKPFHNNIIKRLRVLVKCRVISVDHDVRLLLNGVYRREL
jgi:hypothetical protein